MSGALTGSTALVTGGAVGIGAAIVRALSAEGARVVFTHHGHDPGTLLDELRDAGATAIRLDATSSADVDRVVGEAADALGGRIDILVNNAGGLVARSSVAEMSDEHWHAVIELNLSSAFFVTRAALARMGEGGRIITISSLAAREGGGLGAVAYAAAKSGVDGLTRGLAKELAPRRITVNGVAPGFIGDTPFHQTFTPEDTQRAIVERIPLGRAGRPTDVSGLVVFLASDAAAFITGSVITINGGVYFP